MSPYTVANMLSLALGLFGALTVQVRAVLENLLTGRI